MDPLGLKGSWGKITGFRVPCSSRRTLVFYHRLRFNGSFKGLGST